MTFVHRTQGYQFIPKVREPKRCAWPGCTDNVSAYSRQAWTCDMHSMRWQQLRKEERATLKAAAASDAAHAAVRGKK